MRELREEVAIEREVLGGSCLGLESGFLLKMNALVVGPKCEGLLSSRFENSVSLFPRCYYCSLDCV